MGCCCSKDDHDNEPGMVIDDDILDIDKLSVSPHEVFERKNYKVIKSQPIGSILLQ